MNATQLSPAEHKFLCILLDSLQEYIQGDITQHKFKLRWDNNKTTWRWITPNTFYILKPEQDIIASNPVNTHIATCGYFLKPMIASDLVEAINNRHHFQTSIFSYITNKIRTTLGERFPFIKKLIPEYKQLDVTLAVLNRTRDISTAYDLICLQQLGVRQLKHATANPKTDKEQIDSIKKQIDDLQRQLDSSSEDIVATAQHLYLAAIV